MRTLCVATVAGLLAASAAAVLAPRGAPPQDARPAAPLPDGLYVFLDPDGDLPSAELLKIVAKLGEDRARVIAVPRDPLRALEDLTNEEGAYAELSVRLEAAAGARIPFYAIDPDAPGILSDLDVDSLPAVIVVAKGIAHVREGGAAIDVAEFERCKGARENSPRKKP